MDTSVPSTTTTTTNNHNTPNPPSIELAYKKKCIQLKKRLNEIEAENDLIRARNKRAKYYVAKMRLETCIMLERLATVTGMLDEAASSAPAGGSGGQQGGISAELRAKAAAIVTSAHAQSTQGVMDDETEGSSEEQPPTPQERPLRVKRSRKSNMAFEDLEAEAAMQYEANSPEPRGGNDSTYGNNIDIDRDSRNPGTGDENDRTPSQPADRERSLLAAAGSGVGEERRSSGFRAVNARFDSQGAVPMDVDEKPVRRES
ncbi:hypothetical protein ZTR_03258 [Talaromyces verruculosus]|nr:hypothetical protein ZTR_03258 [Talaromyces verruculosus]